MFMKKFINDVANVEDEMIQGMLKGLSAVSSQAGLRKCGLSGRQKKTVKVALISGGGSWS